MDDKNTIYTYGTDTGVLGSTSAVTIAGSTAVSSGTAFQTYAAYVSPSGISWTDGIYVQPIKFGFTLKFKVEKAKLSKDWPQVGFAQPTPVKIRDNKLKRIL